MARTYDDSTLTYDETVLGYDGGFIKNPTEAATLSEPLFRKNTTRDWLDTLTCSEPAFVKAVATIFSDVATLSEETQKAIGKNYSETATLSEVFQRSMTLQKWVETLTITDTIIKSTGRVFADIYELSEEIVKWFNPAAKTTDWKSVVNSYDNTLTYDSLLLSYDGWVNSVWTKKEAGTAWKEL